MNNDELTHPFIKTISINDLPEGAWTYLTGKATDDEDLEKYYRDVPWLFRGVDIRANAVSTMPFSIYKGDTEIDNSENYENKVGFLPSPGALFGLIEAALVIWNYAYAFKARNAFLTKSVRYILPTTVKHKINADTGEITFTRKVNNEDKPFTTDDIVYFWKYDPFVESGPPNSSPARAAAHAAGVLLNVDVFAEAFFKSGAVKTTLLTTSNIQPAERERLKTWWKRVLGLDKAWQTEIVNAETVKPVVIGEGLESLQNNDLTHSKREDIAAGLGIPYSILWSGNASGMGGGGVAAQDDLHLYNKTIIPECKFIQSVLNDQLFVPAGYKITFTPENLDLFQEDENARAASLTQLITALESPAEFLIAREILGYEIDPETLAKIEKMVAEKEARRKEMEEMTAQNGLGRAQNGQQVNNANNPVETPQNGSGAPTDRDRDMRAVDLEKWQTKAVKRIKAGRKMDFTFESDYLDPVTIASIGGALEGAQSEADVKAVFANEWIGYP